MCAYSRSSRATPSRSRLRSADSRITLADSPSALSVEAGARGQRPGAELGRDHDLVADAAAAPPAAEQFLALPALSAVHPVRVVVRGVDEGAACLDVPVQDRERGGLVGRRAEAHGAQAQHAHLRRVFGSVPIVRYFTVGPSQPPGPARVLGTSLDAGVRSRSNHAGGWAALRAAARNATGSPRPACAWARPLTGRHRRPHLRALEPAPDRNQACPVQSSGSTGPAVPEVPLNPTVPRNES